MESASLSAKAGEGAEAPALGLVTVLAMAVTCGFAVANTYYNQPMMVSMVRDLGAPESSAGLITTATQAGYTLGLVLLAPLGDRFERRRLLLCINAFLIAALLATSIAPTFAFLLVACFLVGTFSILAQYVIPMAAHLAAPEKRGGVIGIVMAGLLIGILGARVLSGFVVEYLDWRAMFHIAAAIMAAIAVLIALTFPRVEPTSSLSYGKLLRSLVPLWREEPVLREATVVTGLIFASFNIFWTTLTPHLDSPALGHGPSVAGLFGLIGIAGALTATVTGRLADRYSPRAGAIVFLLLMVASFVVLGIDGERLIGLVLGVILLDIAMQGVQIMAQARIFARRAEARNRINTIFMTGFFIGGTCGSALGTFAWHQGGWTGVTIAGVAVSTLALILHLLGPRVFGSGRISEAGTD